MSSHFYLDIVYGAKVAGKDIPWDQWEYEDDSIYRETKPFRLYGYTEKGSAADYVIGISLISTGEDDFDCEVQEIYLDRGLEKEAEIERILNAAGLEGKYKIGFWSVPSWD